MLRFVTGFIEAWGFGPTLQETADALGLVSRANARRLLNGLEERGHIRRRPSRARAIEVLHPPAIPRSPTGEALFFIPNATEHRPRAFHEPTPVSGSEALPAEATSACGTTGHSGARMAENDGTSRRGAGPSDPDALPGLSSHAAFHGDRYG